MAYTRGTQAEAARREGVHRSTITRRVKEGKQDLGALDNERRGAAFIKTVKKQMGAE